jgi:hypothetical protein
MHLAPKCAQEVQGLALPARKPDAPCADALCGFDEALLAGSVDSDTILAARRYMPCAGRSSIGALVMGLTEKLNQNRGRTSLSIGSSSGAVQVGAASLYGPWQCWY